jgi:hypothetical protein
METTCPPIPTLQQFAELYHNGEYILVDVEDLQTGEYVLSTQPNWNYLICIQIGENNEQHLQFRFHHLMEHGFINERKAYINSVRGTTRELLFFRKNFRKNFDDVIFMLNKGIDKKKDIGDISHAKKGVLGNPDLTRHIGSFLEPTSRRGGRRKSKRERKNKRKSTRCIRRK